LKPRSTGDVSTSYRKALLYGHHGWGKTTQFTHYQDAYGPGLIISGESGLSSIRDADIDYLPFNSWNGPADEGEGIYSFVEIFKWTRTEEFKERGYKWIGLDILTDLSDHCFKDATAVASAAAKASGKAVNGFEIWADYGGQMIGACKAIRDMPMHVLVTALAKETQNANGESEYWPMIPGKGTMMQLPGIFDAVLCGIRTTAKDTDGKQHVVRYVATDEVSGWQGKVRDEHRVLQPFEKTGNIVELFQRMDESA